jgi:hypothetical protein
MQVARSSITVPPAELDARPCGLPRGESDTHGPAFVSLCRAEPFLDPCDVTTSGKLKV